MKIYDFVLNSEYALSELEVDASIRAANDGFKVALPFPPDSTLKIPRS